MFSLRSCTTAYGSLPVFGSINPFGFSGLAILAWRNGYFKDTTSKELNNFVKKYWEFRKSLLPKNITEAYSVSRCGVGWN